MVAPLGGDWSERKPVKEIIEACLATRGQCIVTNSDIDNEEWVTQWRVHLWKAITNYTRGVVAGMAGY